ncbi:MAG: 2Fe-2S iron-sulfur cluster binding domain-containing protein [Limnohabitans sp.]|nr:2Fe-2S iron-sulfur cluster binding domain-containing protein [Limnohabitans sp.]
MTGPISQRSCCNNSSRILKVHVLPQGDTFEVDTSCSLLEGAERAGWRWPSACRNGTCRSCLCRLVAGEIRYTLEWPGVSAEEKAQGWILPCVARAQSELTIEQPAARKLPPALSLLWSDDDLLVLDKPSGLLAVPGKGPDKQDCLSRRVTDTYPEALVVHRLDQGTSGLMLMARNPEAQKKLGHAFEHRQVDKVYLARVQGVLPASSDWQTIDLPILLDWPHRPRHIIDPSGRPSQTLWRCLQSDPQSQSSLLALRPLTGRTHQLRVHLRAFGHPIWGDALYAPEAVQARSNRLLLHAWRLTLPHPRHGTSQQWEAAPPPGLNPGNVSVV